MQPVLSGKVDAPLKIVFLTWVHGQSLHPCTTHTPKLQQHLTGHNALNSSVGYITDCQQCGLAASGVFVALLLHILSIRMKFHLPLTRTEGITNARMAKCCLSRFESRQLLPYNVY